MIRIINLSKAIWILYAITQLGCSVQTETDAKSIFEKPSFKDSLAYYFPSILNDTFKRRNPYYRDFRQNWYSSSLYSFKEPILYNKTDLQTIYRLLWLRSFHQPVCFVIKKFNGDYFVNAKTLDKQPAFYPEIIGNYKNPTKPVDTIQRADRFAVITFDTIVNLNRAQEKQIKKILVKLDFWNSLIADTSGAAGATDGAEWILEGRENGTYHFITRAGADGALRELGKYLIMLSGLSIPDREFY